MFNATLAGHQLRTEYHTSSRAASRAASRLDINEVGGQVRTCLMSSDGSSLHSSLSENQLR